MRHIGFYFTPDTDDRPASRMQGEIPVLSLDEAYGRIVIQFQPGYEDVTIAYLTALVAEASTLQVAVKALQAATGGAGS